MKRRIVCFRVPGMDQQFLYPIPRALRRIATTSVLCLAAQAQVAHAGWKLAGVIEIGGSVGQLAETAAKTVDRTVQAAGDVATKAAERVKEGKPLDAVLMLQTDVYRSQEQIGLKATQESDLIRGGAQTVATVYGGPGGTAAFNAWYVGRTTGDVGAGLKAGAIAGVTGVIQGGIANTDALGLTGRAIASGTMGGIANVASGGSFEQGFTHSAIASVGSSIYREYTGKHIDGRAGTEPVGKAAWDDPHAIKLCEQSQCFVIRNVREMRALPSQPNHIGMFSVDPTKPANWMHEGSRFMRTVNQVPYMNAMAYSHDILAADFRLASFPALVGTIPPSMVFTYYAGGVDRNKKLLETQIADAKAKVVGGPPQLAKP